MKRRMASVWEKPDAVVSFILDVEYIDKDWYYYIFDVYIIHTYLNSILFDENAENVHKQGLTIVRKCIEITESWT